MIKRIAPLLVIASLGLAACGGSSGPSVGEKFTTDVNTIQNDYAEQVQNFALRVTPDSSKSADAEVVKGFKQATNTAATRIAQLKAPDSGKDEQTRVVSALRYYANVLDSDNEAVVKSAASQINASLKALDTSW